MRISGAVTHSGVRRFFESAHGTQADRRARRTGVESARERAVSRIFEEIRHTFDISFVPDVFAGMERRPAYLEAAWELFRDDVGLCDMDRRTKRIVALAVTANEAGAYYIAACPHAFRLNRLDEATCDKVTSFLRMVTTFERFLSDVNAYDGPQPAYVVLTNWRDEFWHDGVAMAIVPPLRKSVDSREPSWIETALVALLMLTILAIGVYLVLL